MPNLVAPSFMKASARRGLALHAEGKSGDGLKPQTVADARKMAEGTALSEDKWRRIAPWIARHIGDLDAVQGDEITPGLVAMLLWGGGSSKSSARRAQAYAERIVAQLDEKRYDPNQPRDEDGKFGSGTGGGIRPDKEMPDEYDTPDDEDEFDLEELENILNEESVSSDEAEKINQKLSEKETKFQESGGVVKLPLTRKEVKDAQESVERVTKQAEKDGWGREKVARDGAAMTRQALLAHGAPDATVLTAVTANGDIAGAVSFNAVPTNLVGDETPGGMGGYLEMHNLGTLGNADGVGSVLYKSVLKQAAASDSGIKLQALNENAFTFWRNMGFQEAFGVDMLVLNADSVKKVLGEK